MVAWGVYLALGVICVALAWAWLFPQLPRRARLAVLGLFAGLAALTMGVTAQIPHDYRPDDLGQYGRGGAAIFIQLCVAVVAVVMAIATVGRRRTLDAGPIAAGVYLLGTGLALYLALNGRATIMAPALVLVGIVIAVSGACALLGVPRLLATVLSLAAGLGTAPAVEALRGTGNPGAGPTSASNDMVSVVAVEALMLLFGLALLARTHWRLLVRPLVWAGVALIGTAISLVLRGPGEWTPGPGASSTSLYGLPLTVLALAVSLAILDSQVEQSQNPQGQEATSEGKRSGKLLTPVVVPLAVALLLLAALGVSWHPVTEACASIPYSDSSLLSPGGPAWALSPAPGAPRGAPGFAEFARLCEHRTPGLSQIVYVTYPTCKWAQVDANYPLVQASGTLARIDLSHGDSPWIHKSHDIQLDLAVDASSAWLVVDGKPGSLLHIEAESDFFPLPYRPVAGDRVTVAGRWIFDCGHDPATEIHPAAVVAGEHDEWRIDFAGGPQKVRALRIWMNSKPGVVRVPLAPFDIRVGLPPETGGQASTPLVQVVAGTPGAVQWSIEGEDGASSSPEVAVHIVPPEPDGSAYFELLLGYRDLAPPTVPPTSYTVTVSRLQVHDDLRQRARNTTGVPIDLINQQLGFPGTGRWTMQAVVGHSWRSLLAAAQVESGNTYSLAGVPPVPILASGGERLHFWITGYAENDPSAGVQLASGNLSSAASVLDWDPGLLADLCCDKEQTFTPPHRAWTLTYRVSRAGP